MKIIKMILTAVVVMFAAASVSAQTLNDVRTKYNEAGELVNAKKFREAIPQLESVIDMGLEVGAEASDIVTQAQKLLPVAYFQYGLSLCKTGQFSDALPVLDKTVEVAELYGDSKVMRNAKTLTSQAYTAMGADSFNNKDYGKAIEIFSKGYEANPNDTNLALYLAESYAENQDYDDAYRVYNQIIALENVHSRFKPAADQAREKMTSYLTFQASEVAKSGNQNDAYRLLDEIIEKDPTNSFAYLTKVQLATNKQDWGRVIAWGEEAAAVQTDPAQKSEVYFLLGAAYQNTENVAKAIETYRKVTAGGKVQVAQQQIELLTNPPTK